MLSPFLGLDYWIATQFTSSQLRYVLWEKVKEMPHDCFFNISNTKLG